MVQPSYTDEVYDEPEQNLIYQATPDAESDNDDKEELFTKKPSLWKRLCCCLKIRSKNREKGSRQSQLNDDIEEKVIFQENALLPPLLDVDKGKKCLVLDLDETLVHSSFKPVADPDFTVEVEIEGQIHTVYVLKRPGVDDFLEKVGNLFEVVVFTASMSKYANPVIDQLDITKTVRTRLFREACVFSRGNYVKDLSLLGRCIRDCIIIDNSPASYAFQPENAIAIESWFGGEDDDELMELLPYLDRLTKCSDVRSELTALGI
eukprot:GCRY01000345.1.p1 GENE.GCRY01000345.1~~GCRY01000345.1.p1  ORF type:complete len:263 (-),score=29.56 GCRY01000345.1:1224-2012(-)